MRRLSRRSTWLAAAVGTIAVVAVVSFVVVGMSTPGPWQDDPAAGTRDVRLQCRGNHDDPYLVRVTITNHSGHTLDYSIDGADDERTTSDYPTGHTYPFRTELDGVADGAARTVDVAGPHPTGYVVGSRCRLLHTRTRH
ncbi:MAG TPA: hypothetical protein VHF06_20635 [Pseudonocardiaceae bacterium]|nr:hypothetical protein [Pseudonocardiaceae bacterium]